MRLISRLRIGALVLGTGVSLAFSGEAKAESPVLRSPLRLSAGRQLGTITAVKFDAASYEALRPVQDVVISEFAMPDGRQVNLELEQFDIFSPDARIVVGGAGGLPENDIAMERPDVLLFHGRVAGDASSRVYLAFSPFGTNGYISTSEGRAIVATDPGKATDTVIYDPALLPAGALNAVPFQCGSDQLPNRGWAGPLPIPTPENTPAPRDVGCRIAKIAVETDWNYTNSFGGNTANSQAYIATLLGAVSEIYQNQIQTNLQVTYSRVWASDIDPYATSGSSVNNRLTEVASFWSSNMGSIDRTVTHMLTTLCGPAGGIAYLGVLCNLSTGYSVSGCLNRSFPYPLVNNNSGNWDVVVAAHELGHNFGAPHTHETSPLIDGCGNGDCTLAAQGTIMSYCHTCSPGMSNIALSLHPQIINNNIMPFINSVPSCMPLLSDVTIVQHPSPSTQSQPVGGSATFSIVATGGNLTYQWRKGGANLSNGARITGATGPILTITNLNQADAGSYDCRCTSCNSLLSGAATLAVTVAPPSITVQPTPVQVCSSGTAQFFLGASGATPRTYRWQKNHEDMFDGDNISGSSTGLLTISPATVADIANYRCVVTNPGGATPTNDAALTVLVSGSGDLNGDGFANGADVQAFVTELINNATPGPSACAADMDISGTVDASDVPAFAELLLTAP